MLVLGVEKMLTIALGEKITSNHQWYTSTQTC